MRIFMLATGLLVATFSTARAETIKATVNGLVCSFCATGIEKSFRAQPSVEQVKVDLDNRLVTVETKQGQTLDDAAITHIITDAGYSVVSVARSK